MSRTLICYCYFETDTAKYNLDFFLFHEVKYRPNIDYILVINGYTCSLFIPSLPNLTVLKRENKGFDFGGYNHALQHIDQLGLKYDYYIFLNSGVFGPVLPPYSGYMLMNFHWSTVFISKINEKIKLVGPSIVCLPEKDLGGYGPKVEGYFFATDQLGLDIIRLNSNVFFDHATFTDDIINGEYALTNVIMQHGYSIDCMLRLYNCVDWTDRSNWNLNKNKHPTRRNAFYGYSIDPYEVIFHKYRWKDSKDVNFDIIDQYNKMVRKNI
jgi:hypothetical protein